MYTKLSFANGLAFIWKKIRRNCGFAGGSMRHLASDDFFLMVVVPGEGAPQLSEFVGGSMRHLASDEFFLIVIVLSPILRKRGARHS